jgi:hypothetical protein
VPNTSNSKANRRDLIELEELNTSFYNHYANEVNMLSGITEKSREESDGLSQSLKLNDTKGFVSLENSSSKLSPELDLDMQ